MIALYILAGLAGVLVFHILFLCALALCTENADYDKVNGFYRFVVLYHLKLAKFFCNIKIKVVGREKLKDLKGQALYVGNHISDFDPLMTFLAFRDKKLAFISKPENFKIPVFGRIVRRAGFTAIDRENPRNALKTIVRTADLIKSGEVSFFVYPEGTRNRTDKMLPFHDGVFKIAQRAGCPVAVLSVRYSAPVHKNFPKRTVMTITVEGVIPAEQAGALSSHELSDIAREMLERSLYKQADEK